MIKLPESLQEIFDIVSVKALEQNKRCVDEHTGGCRYKNGDLNCFIGFVIPPDQYDPKIEGKDIDSLMKDGFVEETDLREPLYELQRIHDHRYVSVDTWEEKLRRFAEKRNLSTYKMDAYLAAKEVSKLD